MQVNEFYIPATQSYSPIEPAFTSCHNGQDYIIPYAWGAISRVIGECQEYRGDVGQCLGTFHSRDVDTRDTPWGCLSTANYCRVGATEAVGLADAGNPPPTQSPPPLQPSPQTLRTLKGTVPQSLVSESAPLYNDTQAARIRMSYDVYDSPFLKRGLQSTSDPAGWTTGIPSYVDLRRQAQASTMTANEPWGACSSYGNYSSFPTASLTGNSTCSSGNCVLGQKR